MESSWIMNMMESDEFDDLGLLSDLEADCDHDDVDAAFDVEVISHISHELDFVNDDDNLFSALDVFNDQETKVKNDSSLTNAFSLSDPSSTSGTSYCKPYRSHSQDKWSGGELDSEGQETGDETFLDTHGSFGSLCLKASSDADDDVMCLSSNAVHQRKTELKRNDRNCHDLTNSFCLSPQIDEHSRDDYDGSQKQVNLSMSKNAVIARKNRTKKKQYIENLKRTVLQLSKENDILKKQCKNQQSSIQNFSSEVSYLKRVLANQSMLSSLLRNIPNCLSGLSAPEMSRETSNVLAATDNNSEMNVISRDHDYALVQPCHQRSDHRRETKSCDNSETRDVGVCLHVAGEKVSLEMCASCNNSAQRSKAHVDHRWECVLSLLYRIQAKYMIILKMVC